MFSTTKAILGAAAACVCAAVAVPAAQTKIDLAQRLDEGTLRAVNREVTKLAERNGIHMNAREGDGVTWVEGTSFASGTIEVDIRGKDVQGMSFVGVAFHRQDDKTYEVVYLRPFNFRAQEPVRRDHAVQYMVSPEWEWPRLRKEFPEEFENPVDPSLVPTDWVRLRLVVDGQRVRIYAGPVSTPTLEVRRLGKLDGGMVGLWTGNNSEGDFANLTITPAK